MKRNRLTALLLSPALSLAAGCYGYGQYGGDPYRRSASYNPPPPPPPAVHRPPSAEAPQVSMGVNIGFMISEGIGPGADLSVTVWTNEIFALRFSAGYYSLDQGYDEGTVTVMPLLVRAVFATPLAAGRAYRSYWALGMGVHSVDYEDDYDYYYYYYDDRSDEDGTVYFIEGGRDYVLEGGSRVFTLIGLYMGTDTGGLAFKMGYEFGG